MALDTFDPYDPDYLPFIQLKTENPIAAKPLTLKEQDSARFKAVRKRVAAERREVLLSDVELEAERLELDRQIAAKLIELGLNQANTNTRSRWDK